MIAQAVDLAEEITVFGFEAGAAEVKTGEVGAIFFAENGKGRKPSSLSKR